MKMKTWRRSNIIFWILGVLIVIGLMAASAFVAYRIGWQRASLAGAEISLEALETFRNPWRWIGVGFPGVGGVLGGLLAFFLIMMAVRFLIGPRYWFPPHPVRRGVAHGRWHGWVGESAPGPDESPNAGPQDESSQEDGPR